MTTHVHEAAAILRMLDERDTEHFLMLKQRGLKTDPDSFIADAEDDSPVYPAMVRERLKQVSVESGDIVLGAFSPGLVGIIAVTREKRVKRQHKADLHGMYVLPEFRGKGLGRILLEQSLAAAKQMRGLEEIQLIVAAHRPEVVGLYERFGFVREWTEHRALKLGNQYIDAHHMILNLGQ